MKIDKLKIFLGFTFLILAAVVQPVYGADEVGRISTEQLNSIIEDPDLVLLDVRIERDWEESDKKISGAVRVDHENVESWAGNYAKDQKIVLYCA